MKRITKRLRVFNALASILFVTIPFSFLLIYLVRAEIAYPGKFVFTVGHGILVALYLFLLWGAIFKTPNLFGKIEEEPKKRKKR